MYKIKLQQFEGPLDLLLFFVKRDELDIYDIPISKITHEFMEYLDLIEKLDLEIAGDFLLMAATLMQIKVRMLLPKEIDEKGEEIDPRSDLIKALLEYKRYKEMSEELSFLEAEQRRIQFRGNNSADYKEQSYDVKRILRDVTIYDLMKAFKKVLLNKKEETFHQIEKYNITVEEQIKFILDKLKEAEYLHFLKLINGMEEKLKIIVTFVAILELIKMGKVGLTESSKFNDFEIYRIADGKNI